MRTPSVLRLSFLAAAVAEVTAFLPTNVASSPELSLRKSSPAIDYALSGRQTTSSPSSTVLFSDKDKKSGVDANMQSKLVTESIAPWRTIRLFLYGSLGTGAFIGGLINTSGAIAASSSPDFNLQTEVCRDRRNKIFPNDIIMPDGSFYNSVSCQMSSMSSNRQILSRFVGSASAYECDH